MVMVKHSRDRHSRRNRRRRPGHHASSRPASVAHNDMDRHQPVQGRSDSATMNGWTGVQTSLPHTANTEPGSQHDLAWSQDVSSLQYISASDINSSQGMDTIIHPASPVSDVSRQNDQEQWSAIDNYTNMPLRADAWSPWAMPTRDDGLEEQVEVGDDHAGSDREQEGLQCQNTT
ncbi:uncharacterized protein PG986_010236 [Apiospora aurea]|uniref:Uncharacterized protein n=1 Tax=Apiospora aurea TaxID=335848 RepID=A0ABR1QA04_9PEZI